VTVGDARQVGVLVTGQDFPYALVLECGGTDVRKRLRQRVQKPSPSRRDPLDGKLGAGVRVRC
jgi:hypothetical protein